MEQMKNQETVARIRCKGNCFQKADGVEHRCHAYGKHEWCENYMVCLENGTPEYFEEAKTE